MAPTFEKLVVITRKTRLQQLVERLGSRGQARFYIEHAGGDYADYAAEDEAYARAVDDVERALDLGLRVQRLERAIVPTFLFAPTDLVVTVGQDGLVANVATYAGAQPIVAINPDPARFDGVLLPFAVGAARGAVMRVLAGKARVREVTLAEARLADGQRLLAFNDLFLGARSHVSARYTLRLGDEAAEVQSSSGVLVSTGAGSTGWLSSAWNMAAGLAAFTGGTPGTPPALAWEDPRLCFVVREPFASKQSGIGLVAGMIGPGQALTVESRMPTGGVIFSDGVEADALGFDSGAIATIAAAAQRTRLVVP
ncbi:MAG: NAD(+)/NADH kinase [Kofleriaceae bacterium]|nr:NAD(+)/NADH kinase [Kofleriaceae bacterium]MCL4227180.1 NAD(+)/NADH kinase [Myxococcales bacterium]